MFKNQPTVKFRTSKIIFKLHSQLNTMYFKKHEKLFSQQYFLGKNYEINKEKKQEKCQRSGDTENYFVRFGCNHGNLPWWFQPSCVQTILPQPFSFSALPSNDLALHALMLCDLVLHNSDIHPHGLITDLALAGATFHHNLNFKDTIFWILLPTFPYPLHKHIRKGLFF